MNSIVGYHFAGPTLRDGRPIPPDGEWLHHDGRVVICQSGLHGSVHPYDALTYAPGTTLCLVKLSGDIIRHKDKVVARSRLIVARIDAEGMLREFARWCGRTARANNGPDCVQIYLETGDESLRVAARDAKCSAAFDNAATAAFGMSRDAMCSAGIAAMLAGYGDSAEKTYKEACRRVQASHRADFSARVDKAFAISHDIVPSRDFPTL